MSPPDYSQWSLRCLAREMEKKCPDLQRSHGCMNGLEKMSLYASMKERAKDEYSALESVDTLLYWIKSRDFTIPQVFTDEMERRMKEMTP